MPIYRASILRRSWCSSTTDQKCHPCPGKTHDSRFAISGSPIYLSLAHEIRTLENYVLQKVSPVIEKHYFYYFWLTCFSKNAPLCFQKHPVCVHKPPLPLLCQRLVLALPVKTCQVSESPVLRFQVQLLVFDNRFYPIILIPGQDVALAEGKCMFFQKIPICASPASLIPCRRHVLWQTSSRTFCNVRRPSFCTICSPVCAEHSPRMNGVPPRFPRCAKHGVIITWLRWLRKSWYSVTSTGRAVPIAKENIGLSSNDL